jgi:hypothetical protein
MSVVGTARVMEYLWGVAILVFVSLLPYFLFVHWPRVEMGLPVSPLLVLGVITPAILVGSVLAYCIVFQRLASPHLTLWIFEPGILARFGTTLEVYRWEDIQNLTLYTQDGGLCLRLQFSPTRRADLIGTVQLEWIPLIEYIAVKATAEQFLHRLRRIYEGEVVKFGALGLSARGVSGKGFFAPWHDVANIITDQSRLFVAVKSSAPWHEASLRHVAFPELVIRIASILQEDAPRLPVVQAGGANR